MTAHKNNAASTEVDRKIGELSSIATRLERSARGVISGWDRKFVAVGSSLLSVICILIAQWVADSSTHRDDLLRHQLAQARAESLLTDATTRVAELEKRIAAHQHVEKELIAAKPIRSRYGPDLPAYAEVDLDDAGTFSAFLGDCQPIRSSGCMMVELASLRHRDTEEFLEIRVTQIDSHLNRVVPTDVLSLPLQQGCLAGISVFGEHLIFGVESADRDSAIIGLALRPLADSLAKQGQEVGPRIHRYFCDAKLNLLSKEEKVELSRKWEEAWIERTGISEGPQHSRGR